MPITKSIEITESNDATIIPKTNIPEKIKASIYQSPLSLDANKNMTIQKPKKIIRISFTMSHTQSSGTSKLLLTIEQQPEKRSAMKGNYLQKATDYQNTKNKNIVTNNPATHKISSL